MEYNPDSPTSSPSQPRSPGSPGEGGTQAISPQRTASFNTAAGTQEFKRCIDEDRGYSNNDANAVKRQRGEGATDVSSSASRSWDRSYWPASHLAGDQGSYSYNAGSQDYSRYYGYQATPQTNQNSSAYYNYQGAANYNSGYYNYDGMSSQVAGSNNGYYNQPPPTNNNTTVPEYSKPVFHSSQPYRPANYSATSQQTASYQAFGSRYSASGHRLPAHESSVQQTSSTRRAGSVYPPGRPLETGQTTQGVPATGQYTQGVPTTARSDSSRADRSNSSPLQRSHEKSSSPKKTQECSNGVGCEGGSEPEESVDKVFIWDLDETLIVFHSLLTAVYAHKYSKDAKMAESLGLKMEEMIFDFADRHLFFRDLEDCDQVNINDVTSVDTGQDLSKYQFTRDGFPSATGMDGKEWLRKLAFRYRRIRDTYREHRHSLRALLGTEKMEELVKLRSDIDAMTDGWLTFALKSLSHISTRSSSVNVLVTTTQLVPAITKVMLFDLSRHFAVDNIYSATKIGKVETFKRVMDKFGKNCTYVVAGDGKEETEAAKKLALPFWSVDSHQDLRRLCRALETDQL